MKTCAKCHVSKPATEFGKASSRLDGLQPYCKVCRAEMKRDKADERREQPTEVDLTDTKRCPRCGEVKTLAEFHKNRLTPDGVQSYCKPCMRLVNDEWNEAHPAGRAEIMRKHKSGTGWRATMLSRASRRAAKTGLPCSITLDDIVIPEVCPVLGIPLVYGTRHVGPDSATLDKIYPALGYVPGNVQVLSQRANQMKSDASPAELLRFAAWVNQQFGEAK